MTEPPAGARRVLITGAAGRIGKVLGEHLAERYPLRLLYHRTVPEAHAAAAAVARSTGAPAPVAGTPHEVAVGNVSDLAAMERACAGAGAVAHMAADPRVGAPWESILDANIAGAYAVYEAAHRSGVPKVVFASSNHATGYYEKQGTYTTPE